MDNIQDKIEVTSKTPEEFEEENNQITINSTSFAGVLSLMKASNTAANPWTAEEVDKYGAEDVTKNYRKIVKAARFFYRRDPLASSVINKLVDIGISELVLVQGDTSDVDFAVFESILPELQDFAEDCTLEFLLSGLVIPDINFETLNKKQMYLRGIKYKKSLELPIDLGIRDPETIIINSPLVGNKASYYVELPDELIFFIVHKGKYADGTEDVELYREIVKKYPELVAVINKGEKKIFLENPYVINRRVLKDSPYPTPYLYSAIESLRHKRNLRRMDYSIAARVISAIQHVKVGNDEYPLTEDDDVQLDTLRHQMRWTNSSDRDIDRILQLFTNHTVSIEWVFPDTETLLAESKYTSVNKDILYALGIPRILITGETERSQSSDAGIALISPTKTLEAIRNKIIRLFRDIVFQIAEKNNLRNIPEIRFKAMRLHDFETFFAGLQFLYESGNVSRTTIDKEFGFDFERELDQRIEEQDALDESGIPEFAPQPHSNDPGRGGDTSEEPTNDTNNTE